MESTFSVILINSEDILEILSNLKLFTISKLSRIRRVWRKTGTKKKNQFYQVSADWTYCLKYIFVECFGFNSYLLYCNLEHAIQVKMVVLYS